MKFAVGKTHVSNLTLQRTNRDLARVDNDAGTRRKPYGTVENAISRNVAGFHFSGSGIDMEKTTNVVFVGLHNRNQDGFAIGLPVGHVTVPDYGLVGKDRLLEGAIRFCQEQISSGGVVSFP